MTTSPQLCSVNEAGEAQRLAMLRALGLLDTPSERAFDAIVALARATLHTPIALVSLVDERRQWFKAKLGLEVSETPRSFAFCATAVAQAGVLWVADARCDARFEQNPLVVGPPDIRFYAGAPITVRGQRIGTVCAISDEPRAYDAGQAQTLVMLAGLAADECDRRLIVLEIESARREAADASHAKSQFLANVSHELRTPLNGVIGVASVLGATALDASQREMLDIIVSSGETLQVLLDDILDISKIEAGRVELELRAFRLSEILQQSVSLFGARAAEKGLSLSLDCDTQAKYLGDGPRIRQIVSNLVSNAIKFTDRGTVSVRVRHKAGAEGDRLRIEVEDTGPGFTVAAQGRLFERFEQGDGSTTRRHGGTGLGLPIARALAELMGGTLVAASAPGHGATFTFSLDLQHAKPGVPDEVREPRFEPPALPALRVLVADDNATNRRVVELILASAGVTVTCVGSGTEAVAAFQEGGWDFVFMDVQMPGMDGLEAIRRIRALERLHAARPTPIYTLSAHAMTEHVKRALAAGADSHLTKPVTSRQLLTALAEGLEVAEALQDAVPRSVH